MPKRQSRAQLAVLRAVAATPGLYGLELVRRYPTISRGSFYVILQRLETKGMIVSKRDTTEGLPGIPKRFYWITDRGRHYIQAFTV